MAEGKEKVQELIPYQHLHQKFKYFLKCHSIVNEIQYLEYKKKMQKKCQNDSILQDVFVQSIL